MLAKCSNPSCSAQFRHLHEGRLFRLESDRTVGEIDVARVEYFWLCDRCAPAMTLHLVEDGGRPTVLAERIRHDLGATPRTVERRSGLLLRSVGPALRPCA